MTAAVSAIQSRMSQSRCKAGMFCTTSISAPRNDSLSPSLASGQWGKQPTPKTDKHTKAAMCCSLSLGLPGT